MDYKEKVIALLNSKELSQEQKEKLEEMFPELKESEGEMVRKALIEAFSRPPGHNCVNVFNGIPHRKIVAWLEKQGEQKPNPVLDSEFQEASYYIPEGLHAEIEGDRVVIKRGEQLITKCAKYGIVQKDNQVILDDGSYIDLDPSMSLKPSFPVKEGERVKVLFIKEDIA